MTGRVKLTEAQRIGDIPRFASRLERQGTCLVWMGSKSPKGYGYVNWNGKTHKAHRLAYELARGPIPASPTDAAVKALVEAKLYIEHFGPRGQTDYRRRTDAMLAQIDATLAQHGVK